MSTAPEAPVVVKTRKPRTKKTVIIEDVQPVINKINFKSEDYFGNCKTVFNYEL